MSFDFELRLVDSVASPAKRAADSLRLVQENADKAQASLSKGFAASWGKIGLAAEKSSFKQQQAFGKSFEKIGLAAAKSEKKQADSFANIWSKIGLDKAKKIDQHREQNSVSKGLKESFLGDITTGAAVGTLIGEGIAKGAEVLLEAAKTVVSLIGEGFRFAVDESAKRQSLELGAKLSLGKQGGKDFLGDVGRFDSRTGFDDDVIAKMLLPLRRAGLDQKASRSAFAAASDIAAGEGNGGDEGRVEGILELFKKIKLKGGVTEKILVSLGVETKDFYSDLSKQLGIGTEAAKKQAEGGKIDPQRLLNTIYSGIEKRQGGELGTGAESYSNTLEAKLRKLSELPGNYFKKMVESPAFLQLGDSLSSVLQRLNPDGPEGQQIIGRLEEVFSQIVGWISQLATPEGIDRLVAGLEGALDVAKGVVNAIESIVHLLSAAADVANKLGGAMEYVRGIGEKLTHGREHALFGGSNDDTGQSEYEKKRIEFAQQYGQPSTGASAGGRSVVMNVTVKQDISVPPGIAADDPTAVHKQAATQGAQALTSLLGQAVNSAGAR